MGLRYNASPGAASLTLGATGYTLPVTGPERLTCAIANLSPAGGTNITLTWTDGEGRQGSIVIEPGTCFVCEDWWESPTTISGNGAIVKAYWVTPGTYIDPKALVISSGSATNVSDATTHTDLANIITLLGAGLPGTLSAGGGVKVHDVGS